MHDCIDQFVKRFDFAKWITAAVIKSFVGYYIVATKVFFWYIQVAGYQRGVVDHKDERGHGPTK